MTQAVTRCHSRQQQQRMLEIARLWPHLMRDVRVRDVPMRDVPTPVGRTGDVRTRESTRKQRKRCHTPACFPLLSFCFLSLAFSHSSSLFPLALLLPQVFPFVQLNTINDLHLCSIQTLCLHPSYSSPLRKTQTVDHYLRIEYFQQRMLEMVPQYDVWYRCVRPEARLLGTWELGGS